MNSEFQSSDEFIAANGLAILFQIFYPVVLDMSIGTPLITGLEDINALLLTESFVTIFGAIALWWIWHERPKEEALWEI